MAGSRGLDAWEMFGLRNSLEQTGIPVFVSERP